MTGSWVVMQLRLQPSDPVLADDEVQASNWEGLVDAALATPPWLAWNFSMAENGVLDWPCPSFPAAWFASKGARPASAPAQGPQLLRILACRPMNPLGAAPR